MNIYYVYALRRSDSKIPFYIGMGKNNRASSHLKGEDGNPTSHKNHTIKKAIREGVSIEIDYIKVGLSKEEALELEIQEIAKWGRADKGVGPLTNLTDGGDYNQDSFWTEERKIAKSIEVKKQMANPDNRKKISEGVKRFFQSSEVAKQHISEKAKQQMSRPEMIEKLSSVKKEQWKDPEYRKMMQEARSKQKRYTCEHCGKENLIAGMYVRHHSDNCKQKK